MRGLVETGIPRFVCQESRRIWPEEWSVQWPHISASLDMIPEYWEDYWTKESINECVMNGRWQAWGFGTDAMKLNVIILSQLTDFPAGRILQVTLAWGNELDRVLGTIEATVERFAQEVEAEWCEIFGREGWERKLPRFKRRAVVLRARVPKKGIH